MENNSRPNWSLTPAERSHGAYAKTLGAVLDTRKEEFRAALNGRMSEGFFKRLMLSAAQRTPNIVNCTHASVYQAALDCAQLGLEPNTMLGECYLIPYRMQGQYQLQVQIGRSGWIKLAMRTGLVASVGGLPVFEGEDFSWQPGFDPEIIHKPDVNIAADAPVVAAYAWIIYKDGRRDYEVLRKRDIDRIRKMASDRSPMWRDAPDRGAVKSAVKRLIRTRLPVGEYLGGAQIQAEPDDQVIDVGEASHQPEPPPQLEAVTINHDTGEVLDAPPVVDGVGGFWLYVSQVRTQLNLHFSKDDVLAELSRHFPTTDLAEIDLEKAAEVFDAFVAEMEAADAAQ